MSYGGQPLSGLSEGDRLLVFYHHEANCWHERLLLAEMTPIGSSRPPP